MDPPMTNGDFGPNRGLPRTAGAHAGSAPEPGLPEAHPILDDLIRQQHIFAAVPRVRRGDGDPAIHCHTCLPGVAVQALGGFAKYTKCGGAGFTRTASWMAAAAEGLERYSAIFYGLNAAFRHGSWTDTPGAVIPPSRWMLFSDRQYREPQFPYRPFDANTEIKWYAGNDLETMEQVWLPGPMACFPYLRARGEDRIWPATTTGLAFGNNDDDATRSALWEVIERDSVVLAWHWQLPVTRIDATAGRCRELGEAAGLDDRYLIDAYDITTDLGVPTCMVFLRRNEGENTVLAAGSACRGSLQAALDKAFLEAMQGVPYVRYLRKELSGWVADDFSEVRSFEHSAAYYSLFPDVLKRYLSSRAGFLNEVGQTVVPAGTEMTQGLGLEDTLRALRMHNYRAYGIDMTHDCLNRAGFAVRRVVVPGLYSIEGSYRFRCGDVFRAEAAAARIGATPQANPFPHPLP
jgi:thiazole/oxazole-forming peptide maturase SagD family component